MWIEEPKATGSVKASEHFLPFRVTLLTRQAGGGGGGGGGLSLSRLSWPRAEQSYKVSTTGETTTRTRWQLLSHAISFSSLSQSYRVNKMKASCLIEQSIESDERD